MQSAFETILISNGLPCFLEYHEKRLNKTASKIFGAQQLVSLQLGTNLPNGRCKVTYDQKVQSVEFFPYSKRNIKKLKFIESAINYDIKWSDRSELDMLFLQKGDADDVIIIKNGYATDTTIANIAIYDGTSWITPTHPLLEGTTRQRLLDDGFLKCANITKLDIISAEKIAIMNALMGFEELNGVVFV